MKVTCVFKDKSGETLLTVRNVAYAEGKEPVATVSEVMCKAPPELSARIMDFKTAVLSGNGIKKTVTLAQVNEAAAAKPDSRAAEPA